jgi:hypothetical protein
MNKEQQELLDEAYRKYSKIANSVEEPDYEIHVDDPHQNCTRLMTTDEFINKCKTDSEFSQKWGLKIEERELSLLERYELMKKLDNWVSVHYKEPKTMEYMDKHNIPTRAISLMWNQRSVDTPLGLPFNIASYGLLLEIIAKEVNMVPDELIGNLGDTHIYLNQIEGIKEQLTREPFELPKVLKKDEYHYLADMDIPFSEKINAFKPDFWKLENYQSHPSIKIPLSN